MGYSLYALIAHADLIQSIADEHAEALVIPLPQKLAMIPNTDTFYDAIRRKFPATLIDKPSGKLWKLTTSLLTVASNASVNGPIAYIEAEYASRNGSQASIVWKNRKILFGPEYVGIGPLPADAATLRDLPVNSALRILGAERGTHRDPFDALELGAHDTLAEWVAAAEDAPRAAPRRLVNLHAVGAKVEILVADGQWKAARVLRHDHPGLWVQTRDGAQWFVTNTRHIRAVPG